VGVGPRHSAVGQARERRSALGQAREVGKCQSTMKCPNMPAPDTCAGNEALANRLKIPRRLNLRKGQRDLTGLLETSGSQPLAGQSRDPRAMWSFDHNAQHFLPGEEDNKENFEALMIVDTPLNLH